MTLWAAFSRSFVRAPLTQRELNRRKVSPNAAGEYRLEAREGPHHIAHGPPAHRP